MAMVIAVVHFMAATGVRVLLDGWMDAGGGGMNTRMRCTPVIVGHHGLYCRRSLELDGGAAVSLAL